MKPKMINCLKLIESDEERVPFDWHHVECVQTCNVLCQA